MITTVVILLFTLQYKPVQTFVGQRVATYLSNQLNSKVSIGGLYIDPFKIFVVEDLVILDKQNDTLLSAKKLRLDVNFLSFKNRVINVQSLQIDHANFFLKNYKDDTLNLDFILDYFDSGKPSTNHNPFYFKSQKVILNQVAFRYKNYQYKDTLQKDINYDDVSVKELNAVFEEVNNKKNLVEAKISALNLKENTGFKIRNLTGNVIVNERFIEIKDLLLLTNKSRISNYYRMSYNRFSDFKHYNQKVNMKGVFQNSYVSTSDIAHFTTHLDKTNLLVYLDGKAQGTVNNLKAHHLTVKVGKASYAKGDFLLKGLPNLRHTFMNVKVTAASTNKQDLEFILKGLAINQKITQSNFVQKLGYIDFTGKAKGYWNTLAVESVVKSRLGLVNLVAKLNTDEKGLFSYAGDADIVNFDISDLLDQPLLGRLSTKLSLKGNGLDSNNLNENFETHADYIDFNHYQYKNVDFKGMYSKNLLDGQLSINDDNIDLQADGKIDFSQTIPVYKFKAFVQHTNLDALKLYANTSKQYINHLKFNLDADFSASSLENMLGKIHATQISLTNKNELFEIQSIKLESLKDGKKSSLYLNSDLLDASIIGQYDLKTIKPFFISTLKRYIPSINSGFKNYKNQAFTFNLKVKQFDPITKIFIPNLSIKDAIFNASFDSKTNTELFNGNIKLLTYNSIAANNIILDQNITDKQIEAVLSSDKVDLNDSLHIDNVNISNKLRNDSLISNVKLSNYNDINTLDLNAIVKFSKNNVTNFSILPSILKLNNEEWHLEEKVSVRMANDKISVSDCNLTNKNQVVSIQGLVSKNIEDVLTLGFENINLVNLQPLFKRLGISVAGTLNGRTELRGVLGNLKMNNNLTIDSLLFNDTYIGDLTDATSFNSQTNLFNIYSSVSVKKKQNLNVIGTINAVDETLNLNTEFYDLKAKAIQPFLKDLISDVTGSISSKAHILGTLKHPLISGTINLNETRFKVNYLQTIYSITDVVTFDENVLKLKGLKITDVYGNKAIANGTVNLNNIDDVHLNTTVNAKKLMVLNTVLGQNDSYYGKAFASGTFKFVGPVSGMKIDIDAKSEEGTIFNLPLNNSEKVSDKNYITFTQKNKTSAKKVDFGNLKMHLKLSVSPNATVNIYTGLGLMTGKGNADLDLNINENENFTMTGDYIIDSGNFDFTSQEFINKRFNIKNGGVIKWTGNPLLAQLNVQTAYQLRAVVDDLYAAANQTVESEGSTILTEVEMNLTGGLSQPNIVLGINFPSNPEVANRLQAYLNDKSVLAQQAVSLMVLRKFSPRIGEKPLTTQVSSGLQNTAEEFAFAQFNDMFSALNISFLDLKIKSKDEAYLSLKLLDGRIVINGGANKSTSTTANTLGTSKSEVYGEIEALGLLSKDGKFKASVGYKLPRRGILYSTPDVNDLDYVTSFGLRQQFSSFEDFKKRIIGKSKKDKRKIAQEKQLNDEAVNK